MKKTFLLLLIVSLSGVGVTALSWMDVETYNSLQRRSVPLTIATDTVPKDRTGDFITDPGRRNPYDLKDPKIIEKDVEYDPVTNQYIIRERIGSDFYRAPTYMSFEEYMEWRAAKQEREYFARMAGIGTGSAGLKRDPIGRVDVTRSLVDRLFGGSTVDIKPQGNIDVILGVNYQKVENPILLQRQQENTIFNFDMAINMNVTGKIGEKLKLNANYNTQATFDFDNQMRLEYDSEAFSEDEIIKKIEAGNVSLPLKSTLIQGAQSLFGIKTELQFGKLRVTAIASQQRSQAKNVTLQGGTQQQFFNVRADEYDENRHFFLSHFNRETFEYALDKLPQIQSVFKINRIDVYVTNERNMPEGVRDIVAISDLGELVRLSNPANVQPGPGSGNFGISIPGSPMLPLPANDVNNIYQNLLNNPSSRFLNEAVNVLQSPPFNMEQSRDFEKLRARKLTPSEFTVNQELGFISLNTALRPDQVLGVAYEYVYNGKTYQVGEFDNEVPGALNDTLGVIFVRMLKSTTPRVDIPNWHLMMKNFYNINAYQVSQEDFRLDIFYEDPGGGEKRFLPTSNISSIPLIRVFNMDNLNPNGDPGPDGVFDFVPGLTINPRNGRIMFPVLEPFGSSLATQITDQTQRSRYVYQMLYDSTVTRAREYQELNRFVIRGTYKSSISSEISLGAFNIPVGSVRVTAGALQLIEGVDYEIDYGLGRVRILNDALLEPGNRVNVSFEDNALFSFQQKTMLGLRAEYEVSKNLNIGGTYLHLFERPFTQKVNLGDDPINNRIFGLDVNYSNEAPWLTRLVDKLPFYSTKEPSNITFAAEGAYLKPGHSRAINQDGAGAIYLDDFEGVISRIDLRTPANLWVLSSVPQNAQKNGAPIYPESALIDSRLGGVNRALLNWYRIDNAVRNSDDNENPYTMPIDLTQIFRNASIQPGLNNVIQIFDLTYHPRERGPYNYDIPGGTIYSDGLDNNGLLINPSSRWAGIQRALTTNDFEAANIEYVEMWVLNPFMQRGRNDTLPVTGPGRLVLNIGNVSEDILRDSRLFFENGVPVPTPSGIARADTTNWGVIPRSAQIVPAFDIDETNRKIQDVGLDGMDDDAERAFLIDYLANINGSAMTAEAKNRISADPANDNFVHFRDGRYSDQDGIVEKHKRFNNPEGNSPSSAATGDSQFNLSYTNIPDSEDINRDNTLNETEAYYEYVIPFERDVNGGVVINDFITDTVNAAGSGIWYRIKVPIDQYTRAVNNIQDFRSMRFIRMYLDGFDESVTFRFARFELVRNQWRRYLRDLKEPGVVFPGGDDEDIYFDLAAVNFDENSGKLPFNYVIPPGINRERSIGAFPDIFQNEQSLAYNVCDLPDGRAVAAYRILNYDMRLFERIKMFIHAASSDALAPIEDGTISLFMRMGSDFTNNYYEYEIPLSISDPMLGLRDASNIWKVENNMDFSLEIMKQLKLERNNAGFALTQVYESLDPENPNNRIKVIGNPNFGLVKGIMIGVKNIGEDGQNRCFEVWVNELRVNGFDERGGFAALARLNMQLADLGNIGVSGNYSTIGWGGLDQRLAQRSREDVIQYDITANLELGKFFNEKTGIRIPFFAQYSNTYRLPQFDPYDLDIELNDKINSAPDQSDRDSIRNQAIDFQSIKTYSFTNVRKERVKQSTKTPMPWNIENFSLTYSYAETFRRDPIIEFDKLEQYRFGLDYSFARKVTYITPFKTLIKKDKYFKYITDFNFNPLPNSFSVSNVFDRQYQQRRFRFSDPEYNFWVNKRFLWDRNYNLQWDLTRSLKLNYSALANAIIDEIPEMDLGGGINEDFNREKNRQEIINNIRNLGRLKNFSHNINATYTVPMKNIPFLDFINIRATVTSTYSWNRAALQQEFLGNVIQNSQTRNLSSDFNFDRLYQKSKYLTSIEKAKRPAGGAAAQNKNARGGAVDQNQKDSGLPSRPGAKDPAPAPADDAKKKRDANAGPSDFERILIRPLMSIRKARFNYTQNFASIVPGFTPTPFLFGLGENWTAPGWQYIVGMQPTNANLDGYAQNRWITDTIYLNQQVYRNKTETFDARVTLEPFNGFKIDLDMNRSNTFNNTLFLKDTLDDGIYDVQRMNSRDLGSFTISYMAINTLFNNDVNGMFRNFENTRPRVSARVQNELGLPPGEHSLDGSDYVFGLGRFQTDVLIPAFMSAYTNTPVEKVQLDVFKTAPKPNWTLSYDGLTRIAAVKEIFSSVRISHAYRSTLTINAFNSSAKFENQLDVVNDITANYYSRFEIPNIVINESMSPLLGIDVKTKNDIIIKADLRKNRNLAMSFIDFQLSETRSSEYVIGFGYEIKNFVIDFLSGNKNPRDRRTRAAPPPATPPAGGARGGQARSANNLRINCDFSIRDDLTVIHLLDQEQPPIPTRGLRTTRLSPNVEYDVSKSLTVRLFVDYSRTVPATTQSFPITNINTGVRVRFSLN